MIKKYFGKIDRLLDDFSHIIEDQIISKKTFTDEKGSVEGEIFFIDESCLDFLEVINTNKKCKERYKYHFMNKEKELLFRYDNAPHHREIKSYPHHKHTISEVIESVEPNLEKVLEEIECFLIENNLI